jgi:murein DD-endopeptidase MepM/ murein hydrolase activator NlpD
VEGKSAPKTYRALHGDTIYAIGRRFKVSPLTIEALNGFTPSTRLRTGQVVKLPGPQEEEAATAPSRRVAVNTYERPRTPIERPRPAYERPQPTYERPHTTIESPASGPVIIPAPGAGGGPDHAIPYSALPGHLTAPPERPLVPSYVQPTTPAAPLDAQVVLAGRGRFIWPVRGTLLSGFGPRAGGQRSDGLDISAPVDAPVRASAEGDVVYAGALPDLGNLVLIKHEDGWITAYAHLARTEVKIKDHVSQGDEVGLVGQSGAANQPEVYFEIRYAPTPRDKARPVDPTLLLSSQ